MGKHKPYITDLSLATLIAIVLAISFFLAGPVAFWRMLIWCLSGLLAGYFIGFILARITLGK